MTLHYDKLGAAIRAAVDKQEGRSPKTRTSRNVALENTTTLWRCAACGTEYTTEASINRSRCRRIEVVLAR